MQNLMSAELFSSYHCNCSKYDPFSLATSLRSSAHHSMQHHSMAFKRLQTGIYAFKVHFMASELLRKLKHSAHRENSRQLLWKRSSKIEYLHSAQTNKTRKKSRNKNLWCVTNTSFFQQPTPWYKSDYEKRLTHPDPARRTQNGHRDKVA